MKKVLLVCKAWPELSQTYIRAEVDGLLVQGLEVVVLCTRAARVPSSDVPAVAWHVAHKWPAQRRIAAAFAPDWIHAHYLTTAPLASQLAEALQTPFSVRTHSFDVLGLDRHIPALTRWVGALRAGHHRKYLKLRRGAEVLSSPWCRAVFCYPFGRERLEAWVPDAPLVDYFPLVKLQAFEWAEALPRGERISVCNVGAASVKKNMPDFFRLARLCPEVDFHLYMMGYDAQSLARQGKGIPNLELHLNIPSENMAAEYRRHDWLVYTACQELATVGWPLAVAEAQMSGLGICLPELRPDMRRYGGEQAHYYRDIAELADLLRRRPKASELEAGRALAVRCDHQRNVQSLVDCVEAA